MKECGRKIISVILAGAFFFSLFMMLHQKKDKTSGRDAYEAARQMAASVPIIEPVPIEQAAAESFPNVEENIEYAWIPAPIEETDTYIQTLAAIDLETLQEKNSDVLGWILIPGTQINFPLLQGEDNEYYLKRTWDGERNIMGSIFLETENNPDFTDFNTIIYGHNMNDGSMFAELKQYTEQGYAEQHPYVYIRSSEEIFRYEVFAAFEADVESATYGLSFNQEKTRVNFLAEAEAQTKIEMAVEPALTDRVLTLSTCTGTGYSSRWVVQANLKMIYAPK